MIVTSYRCFAWSHTDYKQHTVEECSGCGFKYSSAFTTSFAFGFTFLASLAGLSGKPMKEVDLIEDGVLEAEVKGQITPTVCAVSGWS